MKSFENIWTLELNLDITDHVQMHIDTLDTTMEKNLLAYLKKIKSQRWVLIGIANSHEEIAKLAAIIRDKLENEMQKLQ